MDSVKEFMNIFSRCWKERRGEELERLFKDGPQYFQDVPQSFKALALITVFDKKNGLTVFLTKEIDRPVIDKNLQLSFHAAFHLIQFFINEYSDVLLPHVILIKKLCTFIATLKTAAYLHRISCMTLIMLIEKFHTMDLQLDETLCYWLTKFNLFSDKGVIVRYYPDIEIINEQKDLIKNCAMKLLDKMYNTMRYEKPHILQTNIESLMDLLYNFPPDENDPEIIKFYERVKEVVEGAGEASKSGIIRALIKLMTQQMFTFKNLVFRDHEFWQNKLKCYRDDEQYSDLATPALQVYYEVIAKVLSERAHENNQNVKAVLHSLKGMFVSNLTEDLMLKDLRLNINGLSQFAEPIKKAYNDIVVEEIYSLVASHVMPLYFSEEEAHEYFEDISDYQESLSRILVNISNISHDQIKAILKLSILLIKRYPELSPLSQRNAIDSLKRTFSNISKFKLRVSQEYIKNLVFESIVWSCSHSLLIDAEHQRDIENLPKRPLCYKDYVPLWKGLLNSTNDEISVQQQVVNEIIEACIELIKTLNLKIKTREDNTFSDIAASQIAENETDFRIFHNMVDLYDEIFEDIIPYDPKDKFTRFLYQVIRASYQYPLIAGFYRLTDRILNAKYFIEDYIEDKELNKMVVQYLQNTIDSIGKFPQELQVSCIHLVLHTPVVFLSYLIDQSIPIFKIALTIGLSDYDLANSALTALENYVCTINSEKLNEFVRELLPNLEMYLRSKESFQIYNESFDANEKSVFNNDEGLEKLQKRILLLFGRFEQSTVLEFLYTQSLNTGASWDKKDLLKYSLHFPDYTLDVYLDTMLPRIVELAVNSSDRRSKVAASEVLHSLVSIVLGKTVQYLSADADRFAPLYKTLCPVLLRLGCDADDVIRQIFNPLVLQLTHWLSSKLMLYSPSVCYLVDALFDGLSDETNSTLRDFSGVCLAEFAKWTIKQSTDQDLLRAPININTIVENITNFALHPSKNRRIAAAIAFNYLHKTLATHQEIVSVFWLELLYAFMKSLNGCHDTSIQISLENVKKVLMNRSRIFNQIEPRRKVPVEFEGGTLEDTVNWLLYQCESLDTNVRKKSMELFVALSSKVEAHKSPKNFMMAFLENDGIQGLNTIILKDSADVMFEINLNSEKAEKFLKIILRMLDCYIWILRADLIDGDNLLFEPVNLERRRIFNCIKCFIESVLNLQDEENNFIQCLAKINGLVCEAILILFDFIIVILTTEFLEKNWALQELFNQNLYSLISRCVIEPHKVGFDVKNLLATESLPLKLEELLITLKTKLPGEYLNCMENELKSTVENLCPFLFNFEEDQNYKLQVNSVKGLLLLNKCKILHKLKVTNLSSHTSEAIDQIFNSLKVGESDQWYIELSSDKKKYFEVLLKLLLSYQSKAVSKIIGRLIADRNLEGAPQSKITHGEYFFNTFRDVLIPCLLNDIDDTMKELTNLLQINADVSLFITEEMVVWVLKHKNDYQDILEQLSDELIGRFEDYKRVLNNLEMRKKLFRSIFRTVVRFKNNPLEISFARGPMYAWILKELNETNDLLKKINVLSDFLICLTGENSHSPEIRVLLDGLKQAREAECTGGITGKTLMNSKIKECLQKLIVLLPITKSTDVFYATINFSIGVGDYLFNEATFTCIDNFFSHVVHDALEHIEVAYDLFMTKTIVRERLDVLKHFLLPGLRACNSFTREQFFNKYIKDIFGTIIRTTTNNLADDKKLIVSQIGCYNFIELMFSNLSLEKINNNEGVIAKSILGNSSNELVTQRIFKCTYQIRSFKSSVLDFQEIVRLLHCAAYNCAITIASETKDSKYYLSLFAENRSNGQLIWENIVDCKKVYELSQTFKEYPKQRKKLVNIRQAVRERQNDPSVYTYIKSYDLATSTLNENVYAHDFNEVSLREPSAEKSVTVTLEVDDFNNHECMAPICAILEIISETGPGFIIPDPNNPPRGLTLFAGSMGHVHKNAKLFMLKVILNNQKIFRPYARLFLAQIIDIIILLLDDGPLNYIITDGLLMLVDWAELAIPDEKLRQPANQLFSLLVDKVDEGLPSEYIIRYNFRIIEVLIQVWHKILTLPQGLELRMKCTRDKAIRVILILLANNMATDLICRPDILDYLINSLKEEWNAREEVVLHTCEAIGLFIKFSRTEENEDFEVESDITEKIHPVLRSLQHKNSDRLVKCIHVMVNAYPLLAGEFFNHIIDNFSKVAPPSMAKCLEVFLQRIPHMSPENIIRDLNYIKFYELLSNKVISCEKVCLEIVENLVVIIDPARLVSIAETVESYAQHESPAYRKLMYNIFINIYKKYSVDITDLADIQKLVDMSKKILLRGLLDPFEELQSKLMTFWTEEVGLREKCTDRILDILDIYSPEAEKDFLTIFAIIFLHMTKKSPSYNQVMFEPLNQSCNYRDYAIAISWRMKNLSYKIPLFTSSYVNHYSQRHSFSSLNVDNIPENDSDLMLRATMNTPASWMDRSLTNESFVATPSTSTLRVDDVFVIPKTQSLNVISRRFPKEFPDSKTTNINRKLEHYHKREEILRQQLNKQRNDVRLNRTYRIGDFPDISITPEAVLIPLQELLKKDNLICKDLAVSMIHSLIDQVRNQSRTKGDNNYNDFIKKFELKLNTILENHRESGHIIAMILEMMFRVENIKFDSSTIARVSKATDFNCLGALLLERNLITGSDEPPTKKIRLNESSASESSITESDFTDEWVQLADLYESTNQVDVVLSIFQNHVRNLPELSQASAARANNKWEDALQSYEGALNHYNLNISEAGVIQRHCQQSVFECLARLSNWAQIIGEIELKVENNSLESFIEVAKSPGGWFAPWYFKAFIYQYFTIDSRDQAEFERTRKFNEDLAVFLKIEAKVKLLKELFAEDIAAVCVTSNQERSQDLIDTALDQVREQWFQLSPLSTALRSRQVTKLRGISNVDVYYKATVSNQNKNLSILKNYWSTSYPHQRDDLLPWDMHIACRENFSKSLKENFMDEDSSMEGLGNEVEGLLTKLKFHMIEAAFQQRNKCLMRRYLFSIVNSSDKSTPEFTLQRGKYNILSAQLGSAEDKLKQYTLCWNRAQRIVIDEETDINTRINTRQFISEMATNLIDIGSSDQQLFQQIVNKIEQNIVEYMEDSNDVINGLNLCSVSNLKACCIEASRHSLEDSKVRDCYLKLLKYCHGKILTGEVSSDLIKEFVNSTLRAMLYNSQEAANYFPCLLNVDYLQDAETKRIFKALTQKIPLWRFLKWQAQLLYNLSTPLEDVVAPIIRNLFQKYPNALIYSLRLAMDTNPHVKNHPVIQEQMQLLSNQVELENFIEAMEYLVKPELYLQYYLKKLKGNSVFNAESFDFILKKIYPDVKSLQGNLYKKISKYHEEIKHFKTISQEEFVNHLNKIMRELTLQAEKSKDSNSLKDYSPWLSNLSGTDIEIPGQYSGDSEPFPKYHAKIMKIEPKVHVIKSKSKPIKITIIGNDAKNYNFLVKFGEDLRLDERVEQAFGIMNEILRADIACSQRNLTINTYQIIALSGSLGLIQWIDNTRSLNEYINFDMNEEQKKRHGRIREEYVSWMGRASPNANPIVQYKEALIKYNSEAVVGKMNELIARTEWDLLRRTFFKLNPSLESFITSRRNFVVTYATMCVAHWILGIGDRHLENTLIKVESGKCTGIDFESAFGGGIDQVLPECMPFRLTSQIKGLMKPFDENDEFKTIMTLVLTGLRNCKEPLLAYLGVVASENLNWSEHAQQLMEKIQHDYHTTNVNWLPKNKFNYISRKLNGEKPSEITLKELENQHSDEKYYSRYSAILKGKDDDQSSMRMRIRDGNLTPEEQVKCLLDQATDLNILGRTYAGWSPWI
ncbi:Similar to PRKDC: DNA-dependent protein kinase catalytic subunit (Gallus gallus) [Cotesia congregata]|uniref:non-specific serine/threonine protein kinase n=1 Tax=Cotesia congregata TaxID=51543 RepID=A0A8J2HPT7_COTCN|nr:Similar to PRKDC: DNA-dependent protein kinase catalytic subunit (Gallus gallus) [Cotesia congregata]